jgi:multiple sugar transport system substrate-binding protein
MSIGSSAGATYQRPTKDEATNAYPFEVGIATIPQANAANPKVISQGPSLCIFQKSNPQEVIASWLFVKYLTTTVEFQAEFSMASGYVPVLESVAQNEVYKTQFMDLADGGDYITALSAKVCLSQVNAYYTSPAFNGSSTARDQVGGLLTAALSKADNGNLDALLNTLFADAVEECEYNS